MKHIHLECGDKSMVLYTDKSERLELEYSDLGSLVLALAGFLNERRVGLSLRTASPKETAE